MFSGSTEPPETSTEQVEATSAALHDQGVAEEGEEVDSRETNDHDKSVDGGEQGNVEVFPSVETEPTLLSQSGSLALEEEEEDYDDNEEKEVHQPFWRRKNQGEEDTLQSEKTGNHKSNTDNNNLPPDISSEDAKRRPVLFFLDEETTQKKSHTRSLSQATAAEASLDFATEEQLIANLNKDDGVISAIQPLPSSCASPSSAIINSSGVPGAHAVGGRPYWVNRQQTNRARVRHGASVVVDRTIVLVDASTTSLVSPNEEEETTARDLESQQECDLEVFDARILPERNTSTRRHLNLWLFGGIILAVIGCLVAILVFILVIVVPDDDRSTTSSQNNNTNNDNNNNNNEDNISNVHVPVYPPYSEEFALPQWIKQMEIVGSPAYKANIWMRNDPNLESYSPERQQQRFMMVYFYYETRGDICWFENQNWLSYHVSECDWFSKSEDPVCNGNGEVVNFNLTSNNLTAHFGPGFTQFIPSLIIFDVSNNNLHGKVPSAVSSSNLEVLVVSNNHFEGQLVGDGAFLAFRLRVIKLDGNRIVGSRGSAIYRFLPDLEVLNITHNHFHGEFNDQLKHCPNMTYIGFGHNDIHGGIPSEMGLLPKLQELDLAGNPRIQGAIPSELGGLNHLSRLDVTGTGIAGEVPPTLCSRVQANLMEITANCSQLECCTR